MTYIFERDPASLPFFAGLLHDLMLVPGKQAHHAVRMVNPLAIYANPSRQFLRFYKVLHLNFPFEQLEAYLDQALPAAEQSRLADHLQSCADCQAQMAAELAFIDQFRQAVRAPHALTPEQSAAIRQNLNRRLRRSIMIRKVNTAVNYAVGLVLFVFAIGLFIWWQQGDLEIAAPETMVTETAVAPTPTTIIPTITPTATPDWVLPPADAMLICQDTVGQSGMSLWHFRASPPGWDRRSARFLNTPGFIPQGIIPLPDSGAILVYGVNVAEDSSAGFHIYLWQALGEQLVVETSQPYTVFSLTAGGLGANGYLYATPTDNPLQLVRLDIKQCLSGNCDFELIDRLVFDNPKRIGRLNGICNLTPRAW